MNINYKEWETEIILDERIPYLPKVKRCKVITGKFKFMKCDAVLTIQTKSKSTIIRDGDISITDKNTIYDVYESWWRFYCKHCGYEGKWHKFKHIIHKRELASKDN